MVGMALSLLYMMLRRMLELLAVMACGVPKLASRGLACWFTRLVRTR